MSCVYIHTNKTNGKVYIGKSDINPKTRWGNGNNYKHCKKFYYAIKKYGWDGFTHEILLDGLTKEQASEFEKMYITLYDSVRKGYNISSGGDGGNGIFGGLATREKLKKVVCQYSLDGKLIAEYDGANKAAQILYGKKRDSGIVQVCNGIGGSAHGFVWRYKGDSFDKYDVGVLVKKTSVWQCTVDGKRIKLFDSITEAEKQTNTRHSEIVRCCKGRRKTSNGFKWMYAGVV